MKCTKLYLTSRDQFIKNGYAIFPSIFEESIMHKLQSTLIASTIARSRCFIDVPDIESLLKSKAKLSDPLYTKVMTRLQRRAYMLRRFKAEKRKRKQLAEIAAKILKGRKKEELSGEELWKLSEALSTEVAKMAGKGCQSTVYNDPQMLRAIEEYPCNVWMTNKELQHIIRDASFYKPLGNIAKDITGLERPVLFSDFPIFRESYGSPFGYHCTAPTIGVRTNSNRTVAVSLLIFTHHPDMQKMPLFILKDSHHFVREQYIKHVPPRDLSVPFLPMQSHIPEQLKRFKFDSSVIGCPIEGYETIRPGTVVIIDPHLMIGFGANASTERLVVYRINLISENAQPFMKSPSWITAWRSLPREVNFESPVVFPTFY